MQPKLFQVPHTVFAFRGVLHDPLRELRPDALKLLLRVHLDTLRTQFFPSAIKSARQIVQRTWPESKLTFNLVRHLMYDGFELLVRVGTVIVVHAVVLVLTAVAFIAGTGVYTYLRPATVTEVPSIPAKKPPIVITPNQNDPAPAETGALISKLQGKEIGVPVYFEGEPYGFVVEVKAEPNGQPRILVVQTLGYEVAGKAPPTFEVPYDSVRWHSKDQLAHDWQVNNETVHATVKSLWVELDGKSTFVPTWKPEKR